jgi:2-polyprenyl-6-methoxyphenol hydroxylase-like FAD-dependent oxidoreductase
MTQSQPSTTGCLVVGGGPAGMVLGLLLARAGVDVTVLEKHADFLRDFRGDTVHPSTMQLLDELGLGAEFDRLPQSRVEQVTMPRPDGEFVVLGDLSRLRVSHPYIAMVPQWDLLDLLADAAREEPTFHLRLQTEATGLIRDGERVVGVTCRTADGVHGRIVADATVACDGRWSVLRRASGLRTREFDVPIDAWWFRLPRRSTDPAGRGLLPAAGSGRMAILIPRRDYYQIAYLGRKGTDAQLRARGLAAFRRDIAELVPWLSDRTEALTTLDDVSVLDVRLNRLPCWHVDGLVCIGDAAHAMSPVGGVGINLAVQDAVATATLLAEPLSRGRVRSTDLARIRRRRLLPTVSVQLMQRLMHRGVIQPILGGHRSGPPALVLGLVRAVPASTVIPAYLIGVGLRPEHAPEFARRAS